MVHQNSVFFLFHYLNCVYANECHQCDMGGQLLGHSKTPWPRNPPCLLLVFSAFLQILTMGPHDCVPMGRFRSFLFSVTLPVRLLPGSCCCCSL